ncbi:hypothetical protein Tco_0085092 [Tanacetum coccineum]
MVAFLEKSTGSAGFHQVIDFLNRSPICYALTKKSDVYVSFIKQFWRSVEATTNENGEVQITAIIDGHSMSITEASLRRHLKLDGQMGAFSPQWRFLIHNILHCLSPKKTDWEQFSSNIATAVIYMQRNQLQQHSGTYHVPSLSNKVFNNKKRPTKGYLGQEVALFPTMLDVTEPSTSPSRITSSPSHLPEPSPSPSPSPEPSFDDLRKTKKTYSSAFTKLILRVKKLEARVKIGKPRKKAKVVLSEDDEDDEDVQDDSSKQGRKLPDAEVQEKASTETEPFIQEVTPTEVIQDQGSSEKGSAEISTAGATKGTASKVPVVSTVEEDISTAGRIVTYRRRSEEQRIRKDKGKVIMTESEPKKKSKKELEQERLSFTEAIRLEEQMNEEQRAQIARDEEIARQWDEQERQSAMSEVKSTKKINWNDPSVIRYHALKMKPKTIAQARRNMIKYLKNQGNYKISDFNGMSYIDRPIFEKVWDFNQHIEPMEHGSENMKSPKKIEEKDADTQKEVKEVAKESGAKRKKYLPRKRRIVKRQKLEEDDEKEELKGFLDIIPREEFAEDDEMAVPERQGIGSEMHETLNRQDQSFVQISQRKRLVARRANDHVSITAPDDKNLNKNNIKEIYLLIMNSKVPDYADTRLLWSLSVFIRSTVIWERVRDFQLRIESYQQKVNLTTPTMTFPGIKYHEIYEDRLKHRRQIEDGNVMIEDHLDQEEERLKIIGTLRNCICNKIVKALKHKDFLTRSMTTGNVFILWHCCFQSDIGRANLNSL